MWGSNPGHLYFTSMNPNFSRFVPNFGRTFTKLYTLNNMLLYFHSSKNDSFRSISQPKSKSSVFQEQRLARISILIVWLFLFCHVWKLVPTAFEASYSHDGLTHSNWPHWVLIVENMSHLLIALNSSINFLIYIVM